MPCPQRFTAGLQETETSPDGVKMYTWRAVRRQNLRDLRKQTRSIVFFMAMVELTRVTVFDIVYQGKHGSKAPGPEDYGIAHTVAYVLAYLFTCVFSMFWIPLVSWWASSESSDPNADPSAPTGPSKTTAFFERFNVVLNNINFYVLRVCVAMHITQHIYHVICTFTYVGPRAVDSKDKSPSLNTRKAWGIRALLVSGVCVSMAMGKVMFQILEAADLARVKPVEYLIIVLPIQINLGILLATVVQFKAEKRAARKMAQRKLDAEVATPSEKEGLLLE